jgi:serine phosphatase RsbU (regulator of sigma subunit)
MILSSNNINSLLFINDSTVVAGTDKGFDLLSLDDNLMIKRAVHYGPDDGFAGGENMENSIARDRNGFVWFGTKNGLVRYDPGIETVPSRLPETTISGVRLFFEKVDWQARKVNTRKWTGLPETLVLSHKENHVTFDVTGFFYSNPGDLVFSYFLEPQSKEWTPYSAEREIQLQSLSPGHYTIKVKARNKYAMVGNTAEYSFVIKPPFYRTKGFMISASLIIILSILAFFRIRERKLVEEKIKLEKIVQERTREVVEQKDEIARQRDVVTSQKKEITDSIYYAERIQKAVLPDYKVLSNIFSDYFIILRPKDIVSGDFYWMSQKNDQIVFTAADCTGHGVPGAFMSMLGVSFLNKIVNELGVTRPDAILNSLRENIIGALRQKGVEEDAKDGMDISLCAIDTGSRKLYFSGANNPLYLIKKENGCPQFVEVRGDSMPVGFYTEMSSFTLHELQLNPGDTLYLFSDGFLDQFGGPDGKKFMKTRFRQMLLENQDKDMMSQKTIYVKILEDWMNHPSEKRHHDGQIDDIILLGVRV